jgi:hypothetical protein
MSETQAQAPTEIPPPTPLPAARRVLADENDVVVLTAYALAAAAREVPTPEAVEARRNEATRLLTDYAFRTLHNEVTTLRRDAVSEYLAGRQESSGIWRLIGVCTVALMLSGVFTLWLVTQPERLAALVTALGR